MARWRSGAVTLVLIGCAGATACSEEPRSYRRNIYITQNDCYRDYGPSYCTAAPAHGGYFYGPYWAYGGARPANDPGPGATAQNGVSRAAAVVSDPVRGVSPSRTAAASDPVRGGFGATGRGYRGGGYHGGG